MSEKTLTPSAPSDPQVGKLHERLLAAARKSGVSPVQFQNALAYPGTELEDELLAVMVRFSKKASGLYTPIRADETGLMPDGWEIEKDDPEAEINLAKLDFSDSPCHADEEYVGGDTMIERSAGAYGSLGFGKLVLDAQAEGRDIIPAELRGKAYILLPRTILRDRRGDRRVGYLIWNEKQREWVRDFCWLVNRFLRSSRFVRPRE